jgi:eukaryotic-like serine/threonine-protein kinase
MRQMADSSSLIGQTISHYHIIEKPGSGDTGAAYKPEDTRLHPFVALKLLSDSHINYAKALSRFQREA